MSLPADRRAANQYDRPTRGGGGDSDCIRANFPDLNIWAGHAIVFSSGDAKAEMEIRELLELTERYLGRIHLAWWMIDGVAAVGGASLSGWAAHIQGWGWLVIVLAAVGGFVVTSCGMAALILLVKMVSVPRQIPLRRALQIAYEQCEGTVVGQYIDRAYQDPEERLSYLYHSLGIHDVLLFAKRPPSSQSRLISETHKELVLMPGTSDLAELYSHKTPAYKDVGIRRADLWRVTRLLRQLDPG
jgi:hypothetical protein